jgi:predicted amidohydrolase
MNAFIIAAAQVCSIKGDIKANVKAHVAMAKLAAERGATLVVFPELSLTGYEPALAAILATKPSDPRLAPLARCSQRHGITIIVGAPVLRARGKPFIGAWIFSSEQTSLYRKHHLHPGEERFFSEGKAGSRIISVGGVRIGTAICADTNHASHAQTAAQRGARLYAAGVLISASGYAADARNLRRIARTHAMPVLMANHGSPSGGYQSAGRSAIWDEKGRCLAEAPSSGTALVVATKERGRWTSQSVPLTGSLR